MIPPLCTSKLLSHNITFHITHLSSLSILLFALSHLALLLDHLGRVLVPLLLLGLDLRSDLAVDAVIAAPGHRGVLPHLAPDPKLLTGLLPQQEHGDAGHDAGQDVVDKTRLAESLGVGANHAAGTESPAEADLEVTSALPPGMGPLPAGLRAGVQLLLLGVFPLTLHPLALGRDLVSIDSAGDLLSEGGDLLLLSHGHSTAHSSIYEILKRNEL